MINRWTITFEEDKGKTILEKVLLYMLSSNLKYIYIVFGYSDWNFDLSQYYTVYTELKHSDHSIIKLKDNDRANVQFIYEMLNNYQMCSLYINNNESAVANFDFSEWRNSHAIYDGYTALERYEESHYEEFPLLEKVGYYFDAKSHNLSTVESVEINTYRDSLIEEAKEIALKIGLEFVVLKMKL